MEGGKGRQRKTLCGKLILSHTKQYAHTYTYRDSYEKSPLSLPESKRGRNNRSRPPLCAPAAIAAAAGTAAAAAATTTTGSSTKT